MADRHEFEIGVFTFGELTQDAAGTPIPAEQRLRDLLERSIELLATEVLPAVRAALPAVGGHA